MVHIQITSVRVCVCMRVCGRGSWLGCRDCQPWEWYFSSWAQAPNLHKVMQLLTQREGGFVLSVVNNDQVYVHNR